MKKEEMKRRVILWLLPVFWFNANSLMGIDNALKVRITDASGYYDETVIRFLPDATTGFDGQYDAWKWFSPNPQVPSVFTTLENGDELAINALPSLVADVQIELKHLVRTNGNYTMTFSEIGAFSTSTRMILIDHATGTYHNIRSADSIMTVPLTANPDTSSRFSIVFTTPVTITPVNSTCFGSDDGSITVSDPGNHNFDVELYDATGSPVDSLFAQDEVAVFTNLAPGNYMIEIEAYGESSYISASLTEPDQIISAFDAETTLYLSTGAVLHTNNQSSGTGDFLWDFGDGYTSTDLSPEHSYQSSGAFMVSLSAGLGTCMDVSIRTITVIDDISSGIVTELPSSPVVLYTSNGNLNVNNKTLQPIKLRVYNAIGQLLYQTTSSTSVISLPISSDYGSVLLVQMELEDQMITRKVWID